MTDNDALFEREIGPLRFRAPFLLVSLIEKDPRAIVEAGWRFLFGLRVARDFNMAERIIRTGKNSQDPTLSLLYAISRLDPIPVDEPPPSRQVIRALLLSAQAGSVYATRQLAAIVFRHESLSPFRQQVLECMIAGAQKGDVVCNYELGLLHDNRGSKKDLAAAVDYYHVAAQGGDADAAQNLGLLWATGRAHRLVSDALGMRMLKQAARQGDPSACYEIGYLHTLAHSVFANKTEEVREKAATRWYRRSAIAGNALGLTAYAECAKAGKGMNRNLRTAAEHFAWSALQGNCDSLSSLLSCEAGLPKGFPVNTIARVVNNETSLWWLPGRETIA